MSLAGPVALPTTARVPTIEVAAVLGQQVLERVAADLPGEPAELGAYVRQMLVDQGTELHRYCCVGAPGDVEHVVDARRKSCSAR